jgi:RimJ/RimL family protein N-acetyltransferase
MYRVNRILISYVPENIASEKLYESLGFVKTGEMVEGEMVAQLNLK